MDPSSTRANERLRRPERLGNAAEFKAVLAGGRRVNGRFMTVVVRPNRLPRHRLGIIASKKLGGAVERNRAKRLVRSLFRLNKQESGASGVDVVVIPRRELVDAAFAALEADYQALLRRERLGHR